MYKQKVKVFAKEFVRFVAVKMTWLKWHDVINLGQNVVLVDCKISKTMGGGVKIGAGSTLRNCNFVFDSCKDNKVIIGDNVHLHRVEFDVYQGSEVNIGNDSTSGSCQFLVAEKSKITVGNDCMFSYGIKIFATDGHPVYDKNCGKRINESKNITIGNHVWIGHRATILKGACVADSCIVGTESVFCSSKSVPDCVYVGNPVRIVKRGICWQRNFK